LFCCAPISFPTSRCNPPARRTLATHDIEAAVRFSRAAGFELLYGDESAGFTLFRAGDGFLNLIAQPAEKNWSWWGHAIFYVNDVAALYGRLVAAGIQPQAPPRDAEWGERFFHVTDPDGHEFSIAWPVKR
jgi:uncharacterized glyoxalase superfamily protein PhnB